MKKYVNADTSKEKADFSKARVVVFANLKPSASPISLRLPSSILERLKSAAHRRGIPYQSYIKSILADAVSEPLTGEEIHRRALAFVGARKKRPGLKTAPAPAR